jgi:hypothetical protein
LSKYALVATLINGRKVLVEPNYKDMKCPYRYLSDKEIADETLYTDKKYIWHEQPIYRKFEGQRGTIFTTIEATPIVLARV